MPSEGNASMHSEGSNPAMECFDREETGDGCLESSTLDSMFVVDSEGERGGMEAALLLVIFRIMYR